MSTKKNLFGLSRAELKIFKSLSTPIKIQDYLDKLKINFEEKGETIQSPKRVLKSKKAHCLEAALLASAALWINGKTPLLLDLKSDGIDDDHVVALYKLGGYFGAISKSNHSTIRFRDPVYRTVRELSVSYFHEYFDGKRLKKTLRLYSKPFDLRKLGTKWVIAKENLWYISQKLDSSPHFRIIPKRLQKFIRKPDRMERRADKLREWQKK